MDNENVQIAEDDRLTFRQIVLTVKDYAKEIWKNKLWIGLLILVAALYLFISAYIRPTTYTGKVTFMLNEEQSSGGALSSILGSFGISGTNYNLLKISELSKSRRVIADAIFTKAVVKGKEDWIANHIIREEKIDEEWARNNVELKGFFFKRDSSDRFTILENKALLYVYKVIVGNPKSGIEGLMIPDASDVTQINTISIKMQNDELAVFLSRAVFNSLSGFYIDKSTEQKRQTYELMLFKRDSIYRAMINNDYALSRFNDKTLISIRQTPIVPSAQMQRKAAILTTAYGQVLTNTELAEYALAINTPFVQVIDLPILPLSKDTPSYILLGISSLLLGIFAGVLFFGGSFTAIL